MSSEVETKVRETESTLREQWQEYRHEARALGLWPEDFLEYLIHRLNIAQESNWQDGYNDGYRDGKGSKE